MRWKRPFWKLGVCLTIAGSSLAAAEPKGPVILAAGSKPNCASPQPPCAIPQAGTPSTTTPRDPEPLFPSTDPFSQAPEAGTGGVGPSFAPNIIGDLLYSSRSVTFGFIRVNGLTNFSGLANTSIVNSSVAENNSPLPADRVYVRYNYFHNSQSVTGLSPFTRVQIPGNPPVLDQIPATRKYDTNLYTFGAEKTFLDRAMSVEVRVPYFTGLNSQNRLSVGNDGARVAAPAVDAAGNPFFDVTSTPGNTLGNEDTEFGNVSVILKGFLYREKCGRLAVTGGVGVTIPTGEDTQVSAIDYGSGAFNPFASLKRGRFITIENETWSVSPFVAALFRPNDRVFTQGFASVEVPLNDSGITYSQRILRGNIPANFPIPNAPAPLPTSMRSPFTVNDSIEEQTLLHLDFNVGYWAYRAPEKRWLTGIAPCVEVHYTSTLEDANRVQLPGDLDASHLNPADLLGQQLPDVGPVVGGSRNRVNILNLTAGSTFVFGERATLATGVTVPLTSGDNKTFDWEAQVQLNYYFGRRR